MQDSCSATFFLLLFTGNLMETSFLSPDILAKQITKFVCYNKRIQKRPAEKCMDADNAKKVKMKNIAEGGVDLL